MVLLDTSSRQGLAKARGSADSESASPWSRPAQLALCFDDVPVTCPVQERYHVIAPVLAGRDTPASRAKAFGLSYATITRWLREFRQKGMPALFDKTQFPRQPYTPEKVIMI